MLLYYITDSRQLAPGERLLDKIAAAARAGVDYIQLREKHLCIRDLETLAREALAALRAESTTTKLLINSRVDVALATGADGVHLTSYDINAADARAITSSRREFVVAVSCHGVAELQLAWSHGADFAVYGPVFEKAEPIASGNVELRGVEGLREACVAVRMPVLALGGVRTENARECMHAGAAGVAAIRMFQFDAGSAVARLRGVQSGSS